NVYDWACWARQTVVPLTVVATLRPTRPLPFGIDELRAPSPAPDPTASITTWAGAFQRLDRVLHGYARHPVRSLRRLAMPRAAAGWLLDEEVTVRGDWAVRRPGLAPGGWAFEFDNDGYPDTDDTAEVVLALRRVAHPDRARLRAAVDRGVAWTAGMQSRDGGW